jgi:hypothetical protein
MLHWLPETYDENAERLTDCLTFENPNSAANAFGIPDRQTIQPTRLTDAVRSVKGQSPQCSQRIARVLTGKSTSHLTSGEKNRFR